MIIPSKERVILKRIEELNESLIIDPNAPLSCKGRVIAVGRNFQDQYQPDDIVFFGQYNDEVIKIDGEDYVIVWGDDIRYRDGEPRPVEYLKAVRV
jgi:co-chaperonin GroES (HSP10)